MTGSVAATIVAVLAIAVLGSVALYAMRRLLGAPGSKRASGSDARGEALAALYEARNELRQQAEAGGDDAAGDDASKLSGRGP